MKKSYTENKIIDIHDGGIKAIAGRNYRTGDIVDRNIFIIDNGNAVHSELFKRTDIIPIGIINYYSASITNTNIELDSIDPETRYVSVRATTNINTGDILTYKSIIKNTPLNTLDCYNYIDKSSIPNSGSGVFAGKDYNVGETVSINPFIISRNSHEQIKDYVFKGKGEHTHNIFVQFEISLINHSYNPNVYPYNFDYKNRCSIAKAMKNIKKGEELFISYGGGYWKTRQSPESINNSELINKQKEEPKNIKKNIKEILSKINSNSNSLPHSDLFNPPPQNIVPHRPPHMPNKLFSRHSNGMLW